MTDEEAQVYAEDMLATCPECGCKHCRLLRHLLVALADRASLVEASWSTGLPDGILLRIDAARRHMEGQ